MYLCYGTVTIKYNAAVGSENALEKRKNFSPVDAQQNANSRPMGTNIEGFDYALEILKLIKTNAID